nr:hypothetical protein [Mycobacterium leprae]
MDRMGRRAGRHFAEDVLADGTALGLDESATLPGSWVGWRCGTTGTIRHNAVVAAMSYECCCSSSVSLYRLRWLSPWPAAFGFHEFFFFHACTAIFH